MSANQTKASAAAGTPSQTWQIALIGLFFFVFGFVTWINGALIPYLKLACQLHEWQTYLVTFSFYIAYTVMAIPSGRLLQKLGTVPAMQLGLFAMAFGCLIFIPAAMTRNYALFLAGLFVLGTGLAVLQVAVNPYVTLLGPVEKAAKRINIMGACNKFAGILAPLIFGAVVLNDANNLITRLESLPDDELANQLDALAQRVIWPYAALAALLCLLALFVWRARLPKIVAFSPGGERLAPTHPPSRYRFTAITGFLAIFCSVGAEVIAGDTIGNYGIYHGMDWDIAKALTSVTLSAMVAGNILGSVLIPARISQEKAFAWANLLAIGMLGAAILLPGKLSVYCIAALGFANAFLWPAIWPQTLRHLTGRQLHQASAILIMGIAGGAILPLLYGWCTVLLDNQLAYLILAPCYLYNMWYWRIGQIEAKKQRIIQK